MERDSSFNQVQPYIILERVRQKTEPIKNCGFLRKTEPKPTDFLVGQTITVLDESMKCVLQETNLTQLQNFTC